MHLRHALPLSALLVLFPLSAPADTFIGVGLGGGSAGLESVGRDSSRVIRYMDDDTENTDALAFRIGSYRDHSRAYFNIEGHSLDGGSLGFVGGSYDILFGDGPLRPFLGLSLGLTYLEWDSDLSTAGLSEDVPLDGESDNGLGVGIQGGFLYELDNGVVLELALRSLSTSLDTEVDYDGSFDGGDQFSTFEQSVTGFTSVTLGANYRF